MPNEGNAGRLEPPANIALRIANEHTDGDSVIGDRPLWLNRDGLVEAIMAAIAAERSSAERRNEELERKVAQAGATSKRLDLALLHVDYLLVKATRRADEAERRNEELVRELTNAKANASRFARDIIRLREAFINILDGLEDEDDRVFFGSSNDADSFREHVQAMDAWNWHFIMEKSVDGPDIYAAAAIQRQRAEAAESALESLTGQVGEMRERAAKVADADDGLVHDGTMYDGQPEYGPRVAERIAAAIRALAPSPPGISTTGGDAASGREDDAALATTPAPTLDGAERR